MTSKFIMNIIEFQPTPSSRRETSARSKKSSTPNISTHSLLAEGDSACLPCSVSSFISTHSLLAEGDPGMESTKIKAYNFNPLPPRGGRRARPAARRLLLQISTHSLLAEGDHGSETSKRNTSHFNPLPPRGGRHRACNSSRDRVGFQPTPSSRRETRPQS